MGIRALAPDDLEAYQAIRLRALATNPEAFSSTHARESAFDDDTWRARLAGFKDRPGRIFVDEIDGHDVGVIGVGLSGEPGDAVLWGMWVDPGHRGAGASQRLIDAALGWAADRGLATVTLWVVRSNDRALRLYERHGFKLAADAGAAPDGCADELRMQLTLGAALGVRHDV